MHEAQKFARVVIPSPLKQPLIYAIPENLSVELTAGARVLIPLQKRTMTGVVWELVGENPLSQARDIIAILDDQAIFDPGLLKLAQWVSQYYVASLGEVLATMLPPNSRRDSERTVLLKADHPPVADEACQRLLAEIGRRNGKLSVKTLARHFPGHNIDRLLARLESSGALTIEERLAKSRQKSGLATTAREPPPASSAALRFDLTPEQDGALRAISARMEQGGFETFLLHGVTGSGKTEVYLRAVEQARALGRRSLILIPEISLTPQLLDRFNARFPGRVGVLHSALTAAERWAQWWRILRGQVDVVIGARSAVFAPIGDLGLIVVDEEHDSSYKQEEGVRYNGRDVAVVRGKFCSCPVLLGSATPALESYENCRQGRYRLLEIPQRVEQRPLPAIETIDLRTLFRGGDSARPQGLAGEVQPEKSARPLLSDTLIDLLRQNFAAKRQTLIFLNRRGFANFLQCVLCGHVWRCPYCSVSLTLHRQPKMIACHHCEYRRPVTQVCPECKNESLNAVGAGTEQVEAMLHEIIPGARIARMDRDTTSKRGSQEALIRRWEKGEIDVLVGTQMITKGHDVSGVTLVGALMADLSLNLPDFRAAERTFQLLSQVAGRAGRGDDLGRVIIQTYAPDHYALKFLIDHDYQGFFAAESEFRRMLNYPPYGRLIQLRLDGPKLADVERRAQALAVRLRELQAPAASNREPVEVLGPAPAPIEKLRNRFRWQILLKGKQSAALLELARQARALVPRARAVRLHIDVDPYSML